ncbi:MAG: hypothetical protein WBD46_13910 [Acidobacteriaceae bacterium]
MTSKTRLEQDEQSYFDKPVDLDHRRASQLLNAVMSYGRLILSRYGQLAPLGFGIDREGQVARETLEIPRLPRDPERLWKLLTEHMATRVRRGQLTGLAMAANVTLAEKSAEGYADAVVVTIELESGFATRVTVPYRIYGGQMHNLLPRRIVLGEAEAEEGASRFFARGKGSPDF